MGGGPTWRFEQIAASQGAQKIAGVDEAGRGPLAGPVVAAAVVLPQSAFLPRLNDSKLLSQAQRETLFDLIQQEALGFGIGVVPAETIDQINILQATRLAMVKAVDLIDPPPDYLLIDGPLSLESPIQQEAIIKGDQRSFSIAAAAVLAKVTRDRIMVEMSHKFPEYGFESHKGYPTKAHKEAVQRYGPCPIHRRSFKGVREFVQALLPLTR